MNDDDECILSLRSRRKHKAWGASPRITLEKNAFKPAKRATAVNTFELSPVSRAQTIFCSAVPWGLRPRLYAFACFAGSQKFFHCSWGLRPRLYAFACFAGSQKFFHCSWGLRPTLYAFACFAGSQK